MLYFLHGEDTHKSRKKLHELLEILKKKRPNSEVFKINSENWSEPSFEELLSSQGLFDQKYIVILDNLFEKGAKNDTKEFILERVKGMKEAEHVFLSLEGKVDSATLKKIEKYADKVQEFNVSGGSNPSKKKFSEVFSVANFLANKDKKNLWISFIDLLGKGVAVEEIHGILFWKVKDLILKGTRNYSKEELSKLSSDLVEMTHKVRQGEGELEVMLEKWILVG